MRPHGGRQYACRTVRNPQIRAGSLSVWIPLACFCPAKINEHSDDSQFRTSTKYALQPIGPRRDPPEPEISPSRSASFSACSLFGSSGWTLLKIGKDLALSD